jgi:hypothetical protein
VSAVAVPAAGEQQHDTHCQTAGLCQPARVTAPRERPGLKLRGCQRSGMCVCPALPLLCSITAGVSITYINSKWDQGPSCR